MSETKTCTTCLVEKPLPEYGRHPGGKYGHDSKCKVCMSAKRKAEYRKNPEKYKAQRAADAERMRELHLIRSYGIDFADYAAQLESQNGGCAVCGEAERKLVVDHCHETNQVRGILCYKCNVALGMANDSADRLRELLAYLANPPAGQLLKTGRS